MSINKRKIGYYNICYNKIENSDRELDPFFDRDDFKQFVDYIKALNATDILKNKSSSKKAVVLEEVDYLNEEKNKIKLIIKSCKYNHSPNYMSSVNGSERESDKRLDEGEKELTHICGLIEEEEVVFVVEERRTALTISSVIEYLNGLYKKYVAEKQIECTHKIIYGSIPDDDFLETLERFQRISYADIIMDKEVLGSEGMMLIEEASPLIREEVSVTIKSTPRESLPKRIINGLYESFISSASKIKRVRVYGKDNAQSNITIDTRFCKKVKYIDVHLNDNGIVNSEEIIDRLSQMLE